MQTLYDLHDHELEPRLMNWARWCRPGLIYWPISCCGLESYYTSPQCWEPIHASLAINIIDAGCIEDARGRLPEVYRSALKMWHVNRLPPQRIAKKTGSSDVGQLMRDSWEALRRELIKKTVDNPINKTYNRPTI